MQDHERTMEMLRKYKFGTCNISQFYPRPGTPAARMKRVDTKVAKRRSREFSKVFNDLKPYEGWEGRRMKVWVGLDVDTTGSKNVAHGKGYEKVLFGPYDPEMRGCSCDVVVDKVARFHVEGKVVEGTVVRVAPRVEELGTTVAGDDEQEEESADKLNYRVAGEEKKEERGEGGPCSGGKCEVGGGKGEENGGGGCCGGKGDGPCGGGKCASESVSDGGCGGEGDGATLDDMDVADVKAQERQRLANAVLGLGLGVGVALIAAAALAMARRRK